MSLPRSTLYSHYQQHCQQHNIEPVNAASFGKLIRSVFIGLRTRRLGTRGLFNGLFVIIFQKCNHQLIGNSKYHYYGIRVKPGSPLARLNETGSSQITSASTESSPAPPAKRVKASGSISTSKIND